MKMISVYHDSFPKVTAPNKVRIHACMLFDEPIKPMAKSSLKRYQRKHIVGSYFIGIHEFEKLGKVFSFG